MIVDLHAHLLPPALAEALRGRTTAPRIDGARLVMPVGALAYASAYEDPAERLAAMDAAGVDRQLLSLPGLFGIDSLSADQSAPLTRTFNEGMAEIAAAHPDRFAWLASLPLADPGAAMIELARAMDDGARGVILPCGAMTSVARARAAAGPILDLMDRRGGGHVFVHPGRAPDQPEPAPDPYPDLAHARRQIDIQAEIAEAAVTLLYSDLLDDYPTLTVQVANLGGVLPMVSERISEVIAGRGLDAPDMDLRGRRMVFDVASMGPRAIEIAVGVFGADAIVLGTDQPIFGLSERLEAIAATTIGAEAQQTILSGGARLLG